MKKLLSLAVAGVAGYVLGTKAGRERYEQIRGMAQDVKNDPRVQAQAHKAADLAREKAPVVKEKVAGAAGAAASKVTHSGSHAAQSSDLEDQLNPDNVALQDDPYPKGDLP
jgi:hypothetical protein